MGRRTSWGPYPTSCRQRHTGNVAAILNGFIAHSRSTGVRSPTLPVGLCGVLSTSRRVRGVKAASSSVGSSDQAGGCSGTMLRRAGGVGGRAAEVLAAWRCKAVGSHMPERRAARARVTGRRQAAGRLRC